MKIVSFGQSNYIGEKDLENLNTSDIIIIPEAIRTPLDNVSFASFCLANKKDQTAYVRCLTKHSRDKETILVPQWVVNKLNMDLENVVLKTCMLETATRVNIRFFSKENYKNEEIQRALSKYVHLQTNAIITLNIQNKEVSVKIEKTEPNKEFVTIRNSNVYIEFLDPIDTFVPFLGKKSYIMGGAKPEGKKASEMAREAALRRLEANRSKP